MSRRRVLAIASAGGHWVQLLRLAPAWDGCDVCYVSTDPGLSAEAEAVAAARGEPAPRFRVVTQANRWQKFKLLKSMAQTIAILALERPHAIITTGAAPGYFAVRVGRLMGAQTAWVDSIANASELSLSGQKAGGIATLWLTQWAHLSKPEGPEFKGSVL